MSNLINVFENDGKLVVDSREVAEMVGKQHKDLLESIRGYIKYLEGGNFRSHDFFIEFTYMNSQNKVQPCYLLTKKGCDMVANKMTGEKGVLFTATYIERFYQMEQAINKQSKQLSPIEQLRLQYQVIEDHDKKLVKVETKIEDLENNMPLFNVECKNLQSLVKKAGTKALGGYKTPAYNDNSLRGKVYSDIQHQLRREFGVERYEAIKRCQLNKARKIVESYKAPLVLIEKINLLNSQIEM